MKIRWHQPVHTDCDNNRCGVCYHDAITLAEQMELVVPGGKDIDLLGKYRKWLDENGIRSEVNGWPSKETYDPKNIEDFVRTFQ